jgi:diguanylate cyclase (GGDEF)-like protein/PAS domain S-box-containing protein
VESVLTRFDHLAKRLPKGKTLPDEVWARRHAGILVLLWAHVPALFAFAVYRGVGVVHAVLESGIVVVFAWGATVLRDYQRRWSTLAAVLGLLASSAVLVHLSGGMIEMHFHFFVVVGIITLYQDWEPFLVGIAFVVLQHGVGGVISPGSVYNHEAAVQDPWTWAAIHGSFILAMSGAGVASWRMNEVLLDAVSARQSALGDAQRVARLGSWEIDVANGTSVWSDQMYELTGVGRDLELSQASLLEHVHPDDRAEFVDVTARAFAGEERTSLDVRWLVPGGPVRWLHVRAHASVRDADGNVVLIAGTAQDIHDRVVAEISLRETLSLLNATLDSTADGILVTDLDGVITTINERFADMWRLPRELRRVGVHASELGEVVLKEISDPDGFLARTRAQAEDDDLDSHDVIEFVDGRVFERYSTPQRVAGRVVGRVWTCRDVTEHKHLQDELEHQAFHDQLTGLANQALFRALVDHAVARSTRTHAPMAVLFIDLDNFKTVNDSLGHTVGDELLVEVGARIASCVRPADTTARLGGDEFAVLIEEASTPEEATVIADRIIEAMRKPFKVSVKELYASASIGIAYGQHTVDGDQLLRNADLAMYTAKRRGRGRYEVYAPDMHAAAIARLELEADLRGAVARGELVVHYQPIVGMGDGVVRGVEALARWQHPTRGLIAPTAFIPIAEESDLIDEIGAYVLAVACAQAKAWQADGDLLISVNLSPRQLLDEGIVERVRSVLADSGLAPSSLVLEITEGAMVQDTELAIERLEALKELGVRLAIDDFGTGYSSLSYLHRFPIDIVKIDRSFVEQLATGESSLASAIVSMAQALHLTTIAEGIETEQQIGLLRALGCDLAQGFHLAVPAPAAEVLARFITPARV